MFRFLIVDDNENDALLLTELIEQRYAQHVQCRVAGTRKKALWWLDPAENEPFDCVLLDLNLPDSEGVETFRVIRTAASPIPVVIFSGRDDARGTIDLLIAEGAEGYIHKGQVNSKQVFETMRDAAQRARYTARIPKHEREHLADSRKRTRKALATARTSLPPTADNRLLVEAFAAQQEVISDQSMSMVIMRDQMAYLTEQAHTAVKQAASAEASSQHQALELRGEHEELRRLTVANKRKLAVLGVALAGLGYSIGEGGGWVWDLLMKLGGM